MSSLVVEQEGELAEPPAGLLIPTKCDCALIEAFSPRVWDHLTGQGVDLSGAPRMPIRI